MALDPTAVPLLPWGVTLEHARSVTLKSGVTATVAPGVEGGCILLAAPDTSRSAGVGCLPTAQVLQGKQWYYMPSLGGPGGTLAGMAPDNFVAALVTHADGSNERVPVTNNVWSTKGRPNVARRGPTDIPPLPFTRIQVQGNDGAYTTIFTPGR